jgi:predicted nucleotidyltransferase
MTSARAGKIINLITEWARNRSEISGLALIGSFARETAGPTSDIDLVILSPECSSFRRDTKWMGEIHWTSLSTAIADWKDGEYGNVWSRHIRLRDGEKVELSFAELSWALVSPLDTDTKYIVLDGFKILYDPKGLFKDLFMACASL